jgi:uncharacterized protein involved in tolerance to divalent cations
VKFLIHKGQRAATTVHDATDDVVHNVFNTWFSSCRSSLDEVVEAYHFNNKVEEDDRVHAP